MWQMDQKGRQGNEEGRFDNGEQKNTGEGKKY